MNLSCVLKQAMAAVAFSLTTAMVQVALGAEQAPDVKAATAFTRGDAQEGRRLYVETCASCHGASLEGAAGPTLKGVAFASKMLPPAHPENLLLQVLARMPPQAQGSLDPQQSIDLARYLMAAQNGQGLAGDQTAASTPVSFPTRPAGVTYASGTGPDDAELAAARPSDWLLYNRDYKGQRFSPLSQINTRNVGKLRPVCMFQLGEITSFQASPVIYQGRMYVTTPRSTYALDASTCRLLWKTDHPALYPELGPANRGVALYRGKLIRGTLDGRLLALDAKDGKLLWELRVNDSKVGSYLSMAPIAADGMVFVGESGADFGTNGHVHAFDVETGTRIWTFDVIPTGTQPGAETWGRGSETGGGSVWTTLSYDTAAKTLYASVGNPAPDYDGDKRPGDNLYTNSVVALNGRTGALLWYVQQVPHDIHDWDTAAAPMLFDVDGQARLAVANKGGWLYIYDRNNRRLLSKEAVSTQENADVPLTLELAHVCPGLLGGVQWNGPAYDPARRSIFINSVDWCGSTKLAPAEHSPGRLYFGGEHVADPREKAFGWLRAFDGATGRPLWTHRASTPMVAGVTPTAGGVVFTGDLNGDLLAFDSKTGKNLYKFNTGGAIAGGVSTYSVGTKQYLAVASGNAGPTFRFRTQGAPTVVVFGLPD